MINNKITNEAVTGFDLERDINAIAKKFDSTFILPAPMYLTGSDFLNYKKLQISFLKTELRALVEKALMEVVMEEVAVSAYIRNPGINDHSHATLTTAFRNGFNSCRQEVLNRINKILGK